MITATWCLVSKTLREKIAAVFHGGTNLLDRDVVLRIVAEHEREKQPFEVIEELPTGCQHDNAKPGPRVPAMYGSFSSEICPDCGQYRLGGTGGWKDGPPDLSEPEYW